MAWYSPLTLFLFISPMIDDILRPSFLPISRLLTPEAKKTAISRNSSTSSCIACAETSYTIIRKELSPTAPSCHNKAIATYRARPLLSRRASPNGTMYVPPSPSRSVTRIYLHTKLNWQKWVLLRSHRVAFTHDACAVRFFTCQPGSWDVRSWARGRRDTGATGDDEGEGRGGGRGPPARRCRRP